MYVLGLEMKHSSLVNRDDTNKLSYPARVSLLHFKCIKRAAKLLLSAAFEILLPSMCPHFGSNKLLPTIFCQFGHFWCQHHGRVPLKVPWGFGQSADSALVDLGWGSKTQLLLSVMWLHVYCFGNHAMRSRGKTREWLPKRTSLDDGNVLFIGTIQYGCHRPHMVIERQNVAVQPRNGNVASVEWSWS